MALRSVAGAAEGLPRYIPKAPRARKDKYKTSGSPAARLLRGSRLFCLPEPLARPTSGLSNAIIQSGSDTATTHYPTHQVLETPQSSLGRGDWGMKRSLPLKSTTRTTNAYLRLHAVDSIDHITDFESAADHTLTLRKFQELNLPLSMPLGDRAPGTLRDETELSVFEHSFDETVKNSEHIPDRDRKRWKFSGPWLAGQTELEFEEYLKRKISGRKSGFRQYLVKYLQERKDAAFRRMALDNGGQQPESSPVTEEEIQVAIVQLRNDQKQIGEIIWKWLDLPGTYPAPEFDSRHDISETMLDLLTQESDVGPPTTHPSAGLSYLRPGNIIHNHPELGPLAQAPPVQGRVLSKARNAGNAGAFRIGVGGVVAVPKASTEFRDDNRPELANLNMEKEGGNKVWVHPRAVTVDSKGKLNMTIDLASKDTLAVWEGIVDESMIPALSRSASGQSVSDLLGTSSLYDGEAGRRARLGDREALSDLLIKSLGSGLGRK